MTHSQPPSARMRERKETGDVDGGSDQESMDVIDARRESARGFQALQFEPQHGAEDSAE